MAYNCDRPRFSEEVELILKWSMSLAGICRMMSVPGKSVVEAHGTGEVLRMLYC